MALPSNLGCYRRHAQRLSKNVFHRAAVPHACLDHRRFGLFRAILAPGREGLSPQGVPFFFIVGRVLLLLTATNNTAKLPTMT